jgi:hypothetical protein
MTESVQPVSTTMLNTSSAWWLTPGAHCRSWTCHGCCATGMLNRFTLIPPVTFQGKEKGTVATSNHTTQRPCTGSLKAEGLPCSCQCCFGRYLPTGVCIYAGAAAAAVEGCAAVPLQTQRLGRRGEAHLLPTQLSLAATRRLICPRLLLLLLLLQRRCSSLGGLVIFSVLGTCMTSLPRLLQPLSSNTHSAGNPAANAPILPTLMSLSLPSNYPSPLLDHDSLCT